LICAHFFGPLGGGFKWSLVGVNMHAAGPIHPGVISATPLGVNYASYSLDESYESEDD